MFPRKAKLVIGENFGGLSSKGLQGSYFISANLRYYSIDLFSLSFMFKL